MIQKQLDIFCSGWNSHRIRYQKDTYLPNGVPNHIYSFPEEYGLEDCGMYQKHKNLKLYTLKNLMHTRKTLNVYT